ncbi:ABC transporter permease [Microbacterium lushaniae]|nr:ABC transporter permease [Microbacterium lushaniae]KAA9148491.1 ABC transporter permease [Microbacterium lushaniae]
MTMDVVTWSLFIAAVLRVATPILLAAVGGLISEIGGVPNITLEGSMLSGACAGALTAGLTGSPWLGLIAAVVAGVVPGIILGVLAIEFKADPIVVGIGVNLLAAGATTFAVYTLLGDKSGTSSLGRTELPSVDVPAAEGVPFLGNVLFGQHILTYFAFLAWGVIAFLLARSRYGMHVRAVGSNPLAAQSVGISVRRTQYSVVIIAGALCGIGGAFLSMGYVSSFLRDMTAGRGFIAVAAIFLGGMRPLGVLLAALAFGFFEALSIRLGNFDVPSQLVQAIPYAATLVGLGIFAYRDVRRRRTALYGPAPRRRRQRQPQLAR